MEKDALIKQITILDFMSLDLHLYLNTHPDDSEALKMYNDVIANAEKAHHQYEEHYGPLVSYRSMGCKNWAWENCPWPWQENFNFKLAPYGEERL